MAQKILPVQIIWTMRKAGGVTMQDLMKRLAVVLAVLVSVVGCASAQNEFETEFAKSRYGMEMQSVMDTCMAMQRNGDLPGIEGGEDKSLEFTTEPIDFSKKDDVGYPLQMPCVIIQGKQTLPFTFNKETADADWTLVQ